MIFELLFGACTIAVLWRTCARVRRLETAVELLAQALEQRGGAR